MGWSYGFNTEGREIGYSVQATCDQDGCETKIDRGLAYVCGEMHDGDEYSCGRYFCGDHLFMDIGRPSQMCGECSDRYERDQPEAVAAALADFEAKRGDFHGLHEPR